MQRAKRSCVVNWVLAVLVVPLILEGNSWAVKVSGRILHVFNAADGSSPSGALAIDAHGNIYGTTAIGGVGSGCGPNSACGTIYELSPSANGFTESTLYTFGNGADGGGPQGGVALDGAGNLYGTTLYAGSGNGCGTVFRLSPNLGGGWTKTVLHDFDSSTGDACFPYGGLTFDSAGNLYGTTASGGKNDTGAVFQLTPNQDGSWLYGVIYNFNQGGSGDGANPHGTLHFDGAGNLYGTTLNGGFYNAGTVFEMTPSNGGWTEAVINTFTGSNGASPYGGVIFDNNGNLYGTTYAGGTENTGVVFELTLSAGIWTEQVIHNFTGLTGGANPSPGSLAMDAAGNLYGETVNGGSKFGVLFQLAPQGGAWTENVLHYFRNQNDGSYPEGGITMDAAGNLYGTDSHGSAGGSGIVFGARVVNQSIGVNRQIVETWVLNGKPSLL